MTYQKNNLGLVSWYESTTDPFLLCKGSLFGEESSTGLGLYRFDPFNKSQPLTTMGSFETGISFNCINWSDSLPQTNKGVITAGLQDGSLLLIDPDVLIKDHMENKKTGEDCVLTSFELYETGEFYCMEYNKFKSTLLATGGKDLYIVNFDRSYEDPDIFCPGLSGNYGGSIITSLSWNKTKGVQHILATSFDNGRIDIFDFKLKKSIFSFGDGKENVKNREVNLAWSSIIPTQLAVAFDDADSGVQIWDLRNNKAPVKILNGDKVGRAHSLNWSGRQKNLILCADKEGNFVEYNNETDEYTSVANEGFQTLYTRFVPTFDDAFYSVSYEGNLYINTKSGEEIQDLALKNVPFWLQNDSGCHVTANGSGVVGVTQNESQVFYEFNIVKDDSASLSPLEEKMKTIGDDLTSSRRDPSALVEKMLSSGDYDSSLLRLIKQSGLSETEKLSALDINLEAYLKNTEKITGYSYSNQPKVVEKRNSKQNKVFAEMNEDDALDFFTGLAQENEKQETEVTETENKTSTFGIYEEPKAEDLNRINYDLNRNWQRGLESYIKKNIIMNNYEGAIDCALKANRIFEAFMIAYSHPHDREKYFEYLIERFSIQNKDSFLQNFLQPLTQKDYGSILESLDPEEWRDALTFIVKNIENEAERKQFYNKLIDKLNNNGQKTAALYIDLFCDNFDGFVNGLVEETVASPDNYSLLLKNIQLIYLLKLKGKIDNTNERVQKLLVKLVNAFVDKMFIPTAYELLEVLGNDNDDKILIYKNQLYNAYKNDLVFFQPPKALKMFNFTFPKPSRPKPVTTKPKTKPGLSKPNPFRQKTDHNKPVNIFGGSKKPLVQPPKPKITHVQPKPVRPGFNPGFKQKPKVVPPFSNQPGLVKPPLSKKMPVPIPPINNRLKEQQTEHMINKPTPMNVPKPPMKKPVVQNKIMKPVKPPTKKLMPTPPVHQPKAQPPRHNQPVPKANPVPPGPGLMKKPVPPPAKKPAFPPRKIQEVYVPDRNLLDEIQDFISKTPGFIAQLENDAFKADQMKKSLDNMFSLASNGGFDENTFNEIYQVINSISENDLNKANAVLKSLSLKADRRLTVAVETLSKFVAALS